MAEGLGRFKSRIAALRERGFDVEHPMGDMASEQMLRLEEQADYAAKIRTKVLDLLNIVMLTDRDSWHNLQIRTKRQLSK